MGGQYHPGGGGLSCIDAEGGRSGGDKYRPCREGRDSEARVGTLWRAGLGEGGAVAQVKMFARVHFGESIPTHVRTLNLTL